MVCKMCHREIPRHWKTCNDCEKEHERERARKKYHLQKRLTDELVGDRYKAYQELKDIKKQAQLDRNFKILSFKKYETQQPNAQSGQSLL